jgi:hypothetical protein
VIRLLHFLLVSLLLTEVHIVKTSVLIVISMFCFFTSSIFFVSRNTFAILYKYVAVPLAFFNLLFFAYLRTDMFLHSGDYNFLITFILWAIAILIGVVVEHKYFSQEIRSTPKLESLNLLILSISFLVFAVMEPSIN